MAEDIRLALAAVGGCGVRDTYGQLSRCGGGYSVDGCGGGGYSAGGRAAVDICPPARLARRTLSSAGRQRAPLVGIMRFLECHPGRPYKHLDVNLIKQF